MIWHDMIWYDAIRLDMARYDTIRYYIITIEWLTWHDMTWHDMTWYDTIWYHKFDMIYNMSCQKNISIRWYSNRSNWLVGACPSTAWTNSAEAQRWSLIFQDFVFWELPASAWNFTSKRCVVFLLGTARVTFNIGISKTIESSVM